MDLKTFFYRANKGEKREKRLTLAKMAKRTGLTPMTIRNCIIGEKRASYKTVIRIEEATSGLVKREDLDRTWFDYQAKKNSRPNQKGE